MAQAEIKTKLTADGSELTRALNQGIAKATDFRTQMKGIGAAIGGAFTVGALANFASRLVEMADGIGDFAGSLDVSTDELQAFDATARSTTGGVDGMRTAMKKLVEVQADARAGNQTAIDALGKLGIGSRALTLTTSDLLKAVADYYAQTKDVAGVQDLLGRQAVNVREALDKIAQQSLPALIGSFKEAGLIIEDEGIKKLARFKDAMEEAKIKAASFAVDTIGFFQDVGEAIRFINLGAGLLPNSAFNKMSDEEKEKFFGMGDRSKVDLSRRLASTAPGIGSIEDRVAAEAERRAAKGMRDQENAARATIEMTDATQKAGVELMNFLGIMRSQDMEVFGEQARRDAESMANFLAVLNDMPGALSPETADQRFSDLRRMGANELGAGVPGRGPDKAQQMIDLMKKQVQETGKIPEAIQSIGNLFGVFI